MSAFLKTLMVAFIILLHVNSAQACSRVFWNENKKAKIVARTMDLNRDETPKLVVSPKGVSKHGGIKDHPINWISRYGSVVMSAFDTAVSDGMNEQGLSAHVLYMDGSKYETRDSRPGLSNAIWVQFVLDNYQTVEEAISNVHHFQIVSRTVAGEEWPLCLVMEDASGDSAIFEYRDGNLIIYHGKQYSVATNDPFYDFQLNNLKKYQFFGGTLPLPGDLDSVSRFVRLSAFLKKLPEPKSDGEAIALAFAIIRVVQIPYVGERAGSWPTRWISVADLTNRIYYFHSTTSPNIAWIKLDELNFHSAAPLLELDLHDPQLEGEVSKSFYSRDRLKALKSLDYS